MVIGRIYKIVSRETNECYIGSTFNQLKYRFKQHKDDYRRWKKGKSSSCSSYEIFDKHGIKNCKMLLIKEYNVVDRKHLQVYETLWIRKLKSINKNVSFRILRFYEKMYRKKRLEENENYYKEKYQISLINNPLQHKKRYAKNIQNNPNHNREKYIKYGERQRVRVAEKITCEICSCQITRGSKSDHERTKKHQNNLTNQQQ